MIQSTIVGRLGRDPETRQTNSGSSVTTLSVASDHGFGERKSTTWVRVTIFGKRGENAAAHLTKGRAVVVTGAVYLEEWTDKDGGKRQTLCCDASDWSFVPRDDRGDDQQQQQTQRPAAPRQQGRPTPNDDGVPF